MPAAAAAAAITVYRSLPVPMFVPKEKHNPHLQRLQAPVPAPMVYRDADCGGQLAGDASLL